MREHDIRPILTISGSDSICGAGVQADVQTIASLGGQAVCAITSVTVQTTLGIQQFYDLPAAIVRGQIEAVMSDVRPRVVKIGMIRTRETLEAIVQEMRRFRPECIIYDPAFRSSLGEALASAALEADIRALLFPLCSLVLQGPATPGHGLRSRYASAVAVWMNRGMDARQAQLLAREYVDSAPEAPCAPQGRSGELYRDFLAAVARECRSHRDVRFYAECLRVSARYLAQATRAVAGVTPKAVIEGRLAEECALALRQGSLTIQEVAYGMGFSSQAQFTKFFRKRCGMSPSGFRRQTL